MKRAAVFMAIYLGCDKPAGQENQACEDAGMCTRELVSGLDTVDDLDADDNNLVFMSNGDVMRYSLEIGELSVFRSSQEDGVSYSSPRVSGNRVALKKYVNGGIFEYGVYSLDGTELGARIFNVGRDQEFSRLGFKLSGDYLVYLRFAEDTNFGLGYEDPSEWDIVVAKLEEQESGLAFNELVLGRGSLWSQFDINELGEISVIFADSRGLLVSESCRKQLFSYRISQRSETPRVLYTTDIFQSDICDYIWVNNPSSGFGYVVFEVSWFGGHGNSVGTHIFIARADDPSVFSPLAGEGDQLSLPDVQLVSRPQIRRQLVTWLDRHADPHSPNIAVRHLYGYDRYDEKSHPEHIFVFDESYSIAPPENQVIYDYVLLTDKVLWVTRDTDGEHHIYLTEIN